MRNSIRSRIPHLICAVVLLATLYAGLTPFQKPRNAVTWLGTVNGLRFARYGTIYSFGTFQAPLQRGQAQCSLELWLQPASVTASSTILSFYSPEHPLKFRLLQYRAMFILERTNQNERNHPRIIGVNGAFRSLGPVFITLTSGEDGSAMYLDGKLARSFPHVQFAEDCSGDLIIGTSTVGKDAWAGQLRGLAFYRHELSPSEVLSHLQNWENAGRPELNDAQQAAAVYLFDEHGGEIVRNAVRPGIDLIIPDRFSIRKQPFLEPFWEEYKPGFGYWKDVVINVVGFIPLGFAFFAYWSLVRPIKHPYWVTIVLGFAVSLTIEVLQSFLPTRDSGTTDLITNTLGTFFGVRLCAMSVARAFISKFYQV